jgi:hypothetical protein
MRRITLKHTFVVALAASALAVSATSAQASAGSTPAQDLRGEQAQDAARHAAQTSTQDLRGEQAQDAARLAAVKQDLRGEHARDAARFNGQTAKPSVYWSYTYEAPKPPAQPVSAPAHEPTSDNDLWLILAIALGGAAVFAGTALVVTRHWRVRVPA